MKPRRLRGRFAMVLMVAAAVVVGAGSELLGSCGPFSDVDDAAFCPFVLEIFYFGITTGTSPTTYDPAANVTRLQMAAFLSRTVDGVLRRGSRRASLSQFWTSQNGNVLGVTTVGNGAGQPASDGKDVWVPSVETNSVARVRASDGRLLATWTGANLPTAALSAMGSIFVVGGGAPGVLYQIDPRTQGGSVTILTSSLGTTPIHLTFDGARIWSANDGFDAGVSIITPGQSIPWTVTTVTAGFSRPSGALFDGANVWVTDFVIPKLFKLDGNGAILQMVTVGYEALRPVFDGANIWVPSALSDSVTVVRASNGAVLATLTGNGILEPLVVAFDGERVLVANANGVMSLWKAADLTPIGNFPTGSSFPHTFPGGACSDGLNFWISIHRNQLARF